jgi:hypothetical protein
MLIRACLNAGSMCLILILPLLPLLPHATLSTFHSANKGLGAGSKEKVEKLSFIYNYIFICLSAKISGKTTKNA